MDTFNGSNSIAVKEHNIRLVRRILRSRQTATGMSATKQQIAETAGLSTVTVGTILQQLAENGEVFEAETQASSGGRPAKAYRFNEDHAHVLVLFTQERNKEDMLYIRVANLFGECIDGEDLPLPAALQIESFVPYITPMLEKYPSIGAIGFGLPGVELNGMLVTCDISLVGASITSFYREQFGLPVLLENDVNAAVAGYCLRNSFGGEGTVVYLFFPQNHGPGAGICIGGSLYRGFTNSAGEIGFLPLGIDWCDHSIYGDFRLSCSAVSKAIVSVAGILNPERVILHGDFLTDVHMEQIRKNCGDILPQQFLPEISCSPDFTQDYQSGIIGETLDLLQN
jgi:predicted NBD/HSP70 family sugar kinase/predicted transcriptional regulator